MLPNWKEDTITVNGAEIHYVRSLGGQDSGKPVLVLQHGFSDNGLCWNPVAQELAGDYDILMPDARGHGLSARVQRDDSFDMVSDLAEVMRGLGIGQAVVGGHSMGAGIASQLGARYPELVRALVLEDPPWFQLPSGAPPQPRGSMENSPLGKWMLSLQDKTFEQVLAECRAEHPTWPDAYATAWCQGKKQLDLNFLSTENRSMGPWEEAVQGISCPTLMFTADPALGGIVTPELAARIGQMNHNFRVVDIPGVGHHVRFANHSAYMSALRAFLSEIL